MKTSRVEFGAAVVIGMVTGIWAVHKLPLLRGGMHFEAAPSVSEQLAAMAAASPDREAHMRRKVSTEPLSKNSFESELTWDARNAMIAEAVAELLPDDWQRAFELLIEFSRRCGQGIVGLVYSVSPVGRPVSSAR